MVSITPPFTRNSVYRLRGVNLYLAIYFINEQSMQNQVVFQEPQLRRGVADYLSEELSQGFRRPNFKAHALIVPIQEKISI